MEDNKVRAVRGYQGRGNGWCVAVGSLSGAVVGMLALAAASASGAEVSPPVTAVIMGGGAIMGAIYRWMKR